MPCQLDALAANVQCPLVLKDLIRRRSGSTNFGWQSAVQLTLQNDGKILVGAEGKVARLTEDGILDSTFDDDGIVYHAWGDYISSYAITCQNDGKILVGGQVNDDPDYYAVIERLNSDGSLDQTFNSTGYLFIDFSEQTCAVRAIRVDSSGRILLSLYNYNDTYFVLMRLLSNGSLDNSFDGDGKLIESETSYCNDIFLLPDGKILGVGSFNYVSTVFQLLEDGTFDPSFGSDGKVNLPFGGAISIARLSDGRIALGGGNYFVQSGSDIALFLLNKDGTFDVNLDNDGVQIMDVGSEYDNCMKSLVQLDDKIILVGVTILAGGDREVFMLRIEPPIFTGDNSIESENSFAIYPNPASDYITLSLPSNQNAILSIFNLLGEKVKEEKVTGKQVTMDVSSLPHGMYLVKMENGVVGKFVKE